MNSALARTRLVAATRTEFLASTERLDRMDAFFARHGGWSVFFAHFFMSAGR
jgi:membrane protein DedA with SNARE-associated domain